MNNKVLLMILDGWGESVNPAVSAIAKANTPFIDSLYKNAPYAQLNTTGLAVGLPEGQMGNSEVGHMNIGAGRVIFQNLVKLNKAVEDGSIADNKVLNETFDYVKNSGKKLHFIGLVSDGGVHSHIKHLQALVKIANDKNVPNVFVHAFTDGRDCDPKSGVGFITELQKTLQQNNAKLASITGRYYAMDRDQRWERIKLAYDAMVLGMGEHTNDPIATMKKSYANDITDEFMKPIICLNEFGEPIAEIEDGDAVLFFNFRTDRPRQITEALAIKDFPELNMHHKEVFMVTMTQYDEEYADVKVLYEEDSIQNTLGEILSINGKKQIRIAETEKYPHVTFFFNGGREEAFEGERRILCPSPKEVATYDLKPEMSAYDITNSIIPELQDGKTDFICLNFANTDMVGHTGVFEAAVKAAEVVDSCTKEITEVALKNGYSVCIIADHGNSDKMLNEDGSPNTQHTTNPVPFFFLTPQNNATISDGKLGDLAPSILKWMNVEVPKEMNGDIIIHSK